MIALLAISLFSWGQFTQTATDLKKIEITDTKITLDSSPGLATQKDFKISSDESFLEIANVGAAGGTNRPRYLQIRGQGETSVYENTPSHSVSYFVDDIDLTGIAASWPQLNIENQTAAKGPQSANWGGAASGGVFSTNLTQVSTPARAQISVESQEALHVGAATPIGSRSQLFFFYSRDPGFVQNDYLNRATSARDEFYGSLKFDLVRSSTWNVSTTHLGINAKNGYDVWSLNRPGQEDDFTTLSDQPGDDDVSVHGHALHAEYRWSPDAAISTLSSITSSRSRYSYDADWGNNDYWQSIPGWNQNYDYFDQFERARTAWHQKILLKYHFASIGIHAYGLDEESLVNHYNDMILQDSLLGEFNSTSTALVSGIDYPIGDQNILRIHGRYEANAFRYRDSMLPESKNTTPLWALDTRFERQFSESLKAYALVSRGFKNPGTNVDSNLIPERRFYDAEAVISYELGAESQNAFATWGANLFYADTRDKQVRVSTQDDPTDPGSYTYFTNNAGRSVAYGAEGRALGQWNSWQWELQGGLLQAEFRDAVFENESLRGRPLAHAPQWSYSLGLTHKWSPRWASMVSISGRDGFAFSNNHEQKAQSATLVDIGSTFRRDRWALHLWLKNIFNQRQPVRGFYFANEPPNWDDKLYVQYGPPRRAGLSLTYQF